MIASLVAASDLMYKVSFFAENPVPTPMRSQAMITAPKANTANPIRINFFIMLA
jgi:hypothetical protein